MTLIMKSSVSITSDLLPIAQQALQTCRGDHLVASFFVEQQPEWLHQPWYLIAVGKAAGAMASAAVTAAGDQLQQGILVQKEGSQAWFSHPRVVQYWSGHPVPNEASLVAGDALLSFVEQLPVGARVLALVSGGASAMVEVLPKGWSLADLQQKTNAWLAEGGSIHDINRQRKHYSRIKGGKVLRYFPEHVSLLSLFLSDVEGDDLSTLASGLFFGYLDKGSTQYHLLANNATLVSQCAQYLPQAQIMKDFVHTAVYDFAQSIVMAAKKLGCYIWGGEPVVTLAPSVGAGGRMQHLSLLVAWLMQDAQISWQLLALASDGSDGPTSDAGALVNQHTIGNAQALGWDIEACLNQFNSGALLADVGALVTTGSTGTNVNDVVILCVEDN